jgi:hypothetical protein
MTDPAADAPFDASGERRAQLRAGAVVTVALAVLGAALGLVWQAWSPAGPAGAVLSAGVQPDETEAWVAGDAHYALIGVVVGLLAGIAAWYLPALRRVRGPYVAGALAVGGVVGALLTDLVGWAVRGDGSSYSCGVGSCIDHLPLTVHMHGLWFVEAFLAVLGYGLFVAFAVADDLGRPDPQREPVHDAYAPVPVGSSVGPQAYSVGPQGDAQYSGGHGDAAGVP